MKNTIVSRHVFDILNTKTQEGILTSRVQSSPSQEVIVLDLDLIRDFDYQVYEIIQESLVILGEFTCEEIDSLDWLMVTWSEDESPENDTPDGEDLIGTFTTENGGAVSHWAFCGHSIYTGEATTKEVGGVWHYYMMHDFDEPDSETVKAFILSKI